MPSPRYRLLNRRINELRRHLLPAKFDPTGTYAPRVHERSRAFRLLVHAEFEAFIEDRVSDVVNTRYLAWKNSRTVTRCLVSLVAYHEGVQSKREPTSLLAPPHKPSPLLEERVQNAKNALTSYAKIRNHGVKEDNLLRLLMPLGVEAHEFDMIWLASINSWATTRGDYAHQSGTKIQSLPDPQDELRTVKELLMGFKLIDRALEEI
jgi:hypothetical protein